MTLTIVAVVVTSVLRATRAPMRGYLRPAGGAAAATTASSREDRVRGGASAASASGRAAASELVGVIAVRIDELDQISTAFGSEVAASGERGLARRRADARARRTRSSPTTDRPGCSSACSSTRPATRAASPARIYRGLFEDLGRVGGGVIPVVGIGVGLSDAARLRRRTRSSAIAREAAGRAADERRDVGARRRRRVAASVAGRRQDAVSR